ncbi:UDP binding domain-containing protein, partial [Escherichia coli]|uniref:UDP binding domain-containing protein n=2 Tax=Bacteria TaxID=2 RepID=UPI003CE8A569
DKDLVFIVTEWQEVKEVDLSMFAKLMNKPIVFDGRNCFDVKEVSRNEIDYYSIGRSNIQNIGQLV